MPWTSSERLMYVQFTPCVYGVLLGAASGGVLEKAVLKDSYSETCLVKFVVKIYLKSTYEEVDF